MADVRRFDPGQKRDPNGTWGDGVPGSSFDMTGMSEVVTVEGTFGDLALGVDGAGDIRLAFEEGGKLRELDLPGEEVAELGDALERLGAARDELLEDDDDLDPRGVYDDEAWGADGDHRVELLGSGMLVVTLGFGSADPWQLLLDPPDEVGPDDTRLLLGAIDDVLAGLDPGRSRPAGTREVRRYNPSQARDPGGEGGGQWTGSGGLKDSLKLAGKIDLAPGEVLVGSGKVDADMGGVRVALTEQDGKRMLRFGAGGEDYGKRNPTDGIAAWDGNPPREPLSAAERERLDAEWEAIDAEYESASPARREEISARQDDISVALGEANEWFNGTAKLDEYSWKRLADRLRPALEEAADREKAEKAAWEELDDVEPTPGRQAELERLVRVGGDSVVFADGIIPGSEWGDVHYRVELDDGSVGTEVSIGVKPKGAPDSWGDDLDWQGRFTVAETRKILRLLERLSAEPQTTRTKPLEEAAVLTRAFQPEQHPRAPAGSDTGGEFTKGGSGQKKTTPKRAPASRRPRSPAVDGVLSYDPGADQGTGYGSPDGDPRVHDLQESLNRLGVKDSAGKPLKKDGKLGPKTTSAVKALQKQLGLKPDGRVTPELLKQIKSTKSLPASKRSAFMDVCVRAFDFEFESRSTRSTDGRILEGYAAVFDAPTRIAAVGGDFDEVISRGAFTRSLRSRVPVLQFEHGRDPRVGAVPIGSIDDLSEDSRGLHVRATLFDNPVVEPVRQAIAGRAIRGMSFRFNVVDGGDTWERRAGALDLRTVGDADVHELGPVVFPAYDATTVSVRSLLAQLGPEEHRTLLQQLAHDLRSIDFDTTGVGPSARSSGDAGTKRDQSSDLQHLPLRQRLDQGALQARGILK